MSRTAPSSGTVCLLLGAQLALSACATTTVRSGKPPGEVAGGYDERWQPAFLFGAVPMREFENLDEICLRGWAEVRVRADPFTALAGLLTLFVYSPSRLTIVCAAEQGDTPPALRSYPAPRLSPPSGAGATLAP